MANSPGRPGKRGGPARAVAPPVFRRGVRLHSKLCCDFQSVLLREQNSVKGSQVLRKTRLLNINKACSPVSSFSPIVNGLATAWPGEGYEYQRSASYLSFVGNYLTLGLRWMQHVNITHSSCIDLSDLYSENPGGRLWLFKRACIQRPFLMVKVGQVHVMYWARLTSELFGHTKYSSMHHYRDS